MALSRAGCATLSVTFAGRTIAAVPGESLAAALLAAGEMHHCTGKDGTARGAFCGMGVCHDCLVTVDGKASQRACLTTVKDAMVVDRQDSRKLALGTLIDQGPLPAGMAEEAMDCLVIGAGPAGLAAAISAARSGLRVVVLDERKAAGGQYYKQNLTPPAKPDKQMREGTRLIAEAKQAGVEFRPETLVWGAFHSEDQMEITTLHQGVSQIVKPGTLVIATGAYEAPPLFPGWTLPGVMTTGALQTALRSYGTCPQVPILVAGNGPLNFQVALELAEAGATVIGVVEAAEAPWTRPQAAAALFKAHPQLALAGLSLIAKLRAKGIAIHWGHRIVAASGEDAVKA